MKNQRDGVKLFEDISSLKVSMYTVVLCISNPSTQQHRTPASSPGYIKHQAKPLVKRPYKPSILQIVVSISIAGRNNSKHWS